MKRKDLINALRYAGYHNDRSTATRLFIENRISFDAMQKAFREGLKARDKNTIQSPRVRCDDGAA